MVNANKSKPSQYKTFETDVSGAAVSELGVKSNIEVIAAQGSVQSNKAKFLKRGDSDKDKTPALEMHSNPTSPVRVTSTGPGVDPDRKTEASTCEQKQKGNYHINHHFYQ